MQKIVYFDENAALDYIILKDGGKKVTENITKFNGDIEGKLFAELGDKVDEEIQSKILNFIKKTIFNSSLGVDGKVDGMVNKSYTTTLTNTLLTDYIKKAKRDSKIEKLKKVNIDVYPNSMAYYRLYTPYMGLINGASNYEGLNLMNLDSILSEVKGYAEVVTKNEKKQMIVLRFNSSTFRNNYKLSDILKMDLDLYSIRVGSINKAKLQLENEIKMVDAQVTIEEILGEQKDEDNQLIEVYDVVLAGVSNE